MTVPARTVKNEIGTDGSTLDVSVVIPALNAAHSLGTAVRSVGAVRAVIVVDGGSQDGSGTAAEAAGARVLIAPRGRGTQIAAGIAASGPGWILILHADTRMGPGWRGAARDHMKGDTTRAASFRFALDSDDPAARRLESLVAWRCRILGLPYGDQGLLVHTDLLDAVGGVRPLPLMEDVDLIRRIGRSRLTMLAPAAITSAEKWRRDGWYRRSARNLCCLALWFLWVPPRVIARVYR